MSTSSSYPKEELLIGDKLIMLWRDSDTKIWKLVVNEKKGNQWINLISVESIRKKHVDELFNEAISFAKAALKHQKEKTLME
ncbi:MAG: hypothetical protein K6T87_16100 [Roseiflexus sp.]|uniref:hypothetical protein n=1 Tax=Roseiflexus sp. TaxID=2562120 RepID=UPI0025D91001|nr:hypothetical protein [Roseiflexus sp.]MCL6542079.1 hypothetical protein [Roseiflexus sp.]